MRQRTSKNKPFIYTSKRKENTENIEGLYSDFGGGFQVKTGEKVKIGIKMDISDVTDGFYFLSFTTEKGRATKSLIVEK